MLITAFFQILSQWDKDISSPPYTVNKTLYVKRKVKYKNFDRILTVALFGNYSHNVPKPKCTQVKMYLHGDKIYSSGWGWGGGGKDTFYDIFCTENILNLSLTKQ